MSVTEDTKKVVEAVGAAEAVTDAAKTAEAAADVVSAVTTQNPAVNVEKVVDVIQKAGKAYENTSSQKAGNAIGRLFDGVRELFGAGKEIAKKIEEGGGPKILR